MARLLCPAAFLLTFLIPAGSAAGQISARSSASTSQSQALQVELTNTIRAKNAKVGDVVTARTVTALILPNQVVIPEGSKVIGYVTQASSGVGSGDAAIAIQFDKFELKKRQTLRADLSIRSGAMYERPLHPAESDDEMAEAQPAPSTSTTPNNPEKPSRMTLGGITNSTEEQSKLAQPSTSGAQQPPVTAQSDNSRGDMRAAAHGTLIGMPGVALRLDETSGAATFVSTNRKLELRSGLQLMLSVEAVKTVAPVAGSPPK
jgi:hypothetical protein